MLPQSNSEATTGTAPTARTGRRTAKAPKKAKVAALKAQVEQGTFQVDAGRVAERMVATGALSRRGAR